MVTITQIHIENFFGKGTFVSGPQSRSLYTHNKETL